MKKFIKVFLLILFIIFVLGITTSNADTALVDTTGETMLTWLENGKGIKVSTDDLMIRNPYLYCDNINKAMLDNTDYTIYTPSTTYPGTHSKGYIFAYIFAAPGYSGEMRHSAWWGERRWIWLC